MKRLVQVLSFFLLMAILASCAGTSGGNTATSQQTTALTTQRQETQTSAIEPSATNQSKYDVTPDERKAILDANLAELEFDAFAELYPEDLFPITSEKVTMTMGMVRGAINGNMSEMSLIRKLGALANIDIQCIDIPATSRTETLNLMLASGEELPHCFWGVNVFSDNDIVTYGASGTFLDFMQYIDVMPILQGIMKKCEWQFEVCKTSNGALYTLPYIEQQDGNTSVASIHFINGRWLDNLGLEIPSTTDEYVEVLRAFRDQDANKNGNNSDEIPLTSHVGDTQKAFSYLYGAFGSRDNKDHYEVKDGIVASTANTNEYKNAIIWMRSLYEDNLIDNEAFTQDGASFNARANQDGGIYGAFVCWRASAFMSRENADTYIPVPPLTGPDGYRMWSRENSMECIKNAFVMTKDAPEPELVARFADACYNEYISVETNWGPFGIIQNLDENNQWAADDTIVPDNYNFSEWRDYNRSKGPAACLNEYYETFCAWDFNALYRTGILKDIYFPLYPDEFYPPLYFSVEDSNRLNTIETQYRNYVNEMEAKWISAGGIEDEWESYLANLENIGLSEALSIRQKYYDDTYNK